MTVSVSNRFLIFLGILIPFLIFNKRLCRN
jgi:hypothetical protein